MITKPIAQLIFFLLFFLFQFRTDLNSAHWQTEIEGLGAIVRLMKYHSDIILVDVNDLIYALNHECKNLRSQVCVFREVGTKFM